jgi:hypothetical protein
VGSRLNIRSEEFLPAENHEWLGSAHGTQEMESITLDHAAFLAVYTDGVVPSGVVVARNVAGTKVVPYATAAGDATGIAVGHLFTTTIVPTDADTTGSLFWHGSVIKSKLPTGHRLDAAAEADLKHIHYRP